MYLLCPLLITFTNNLDPDQARQNVGPDLNQNCLTHCIPEFLNIEFGERKKTGRRTDNISNIASMQREKSDSK